MAISHQPAGPAPAHAEVPRRHRLLPALREAQQEQGYISQEAMLRIARELNLSPSIVYGVATFYHELVVSDRPVLVIRVCDSPSCHLAGSEVLLAALQHLVRERTAAANDQGVAIRVERVGCLGQCDHSPAMILGGRLLTGVRERDLRLLLEQALHEVATGRQPAAARPTADRHASKGDGAT